jgi:hypothetical protein
VATNLSLNWACPSRTVRECPRFTRACVLAHRLYRGLLPEVAGGMPRSSAMFAGFAATQRQLVRVCELSLWWKPGLVGSFL